MLIALREIAVTAGLLMSILGCNRGEAPQSRTLRLATTTSTRDSGLLDALLPPFEAQHNVQVDVIAVGTGKAIQLGQAGDVDVVLVHARQAEDAFMAAGHGVRRENVMSNCFELVGPPGDPAGIRGLSAREGLQTIAAAGCYFISRSDDSGTHKRELQLWNKSGSRPDWPEYLEAGQGMGVTLTIADQKQGYTLTDRGTYLRFRNQLDLAPLSAQSEDLINPYGIMVVNPDKHPAVQGELANAFVDFLLSPHAQSLIAKYQLFNETLFVPWRSFPRE
ncbi:MAG: substrate-binding domain-containing protein [Pirellulales bacterium]|nr:substrate-binding domain-containing protein [Pirellulales bacterium]